MCPTKSQPNGLFHQSKDCVTNPDFLTPGGHSESVDERVEEKRKMEQDPSSIVKVNGTFSSFYRLSLFFL